MDKITGRRRPLSMMKVFELKPMRSNSWVQGSSSSSKWYMLTTRSSMSIRSNVVRMNISRYRAFARPGNYTLSTGRYMASWRAFIICHRLLSENFIKKLTLNEDAPKAAMPSVAISLEASIASAKAPSQIWGPMILFTVFDFFTKLPSYAWKSFGLMNLICTSSYVCSIDTISGLSKFT